MIRFDRLIPLVLVGLLPWPLILATIPQPIQGPPSDLSWQLSFPLDSR